MKVAVPKEVVEGEQRVALVPDTVQKLVEQEHEVAVEKGAGREYHPDAAYEEAGAELVSEVEELYRGADLVLKVQPPTEDEVEQLEEETALVSFLDPPGNPELVEKLAERGVTTFSFNLVPRIGRAQNMDALSSMASIAGYKSVLIGAEQLGKYLPMMTTAAGTTKASKVVVIGAGVAGLQAIATAVRLGADVHAFDIRPEVKEQVESLGATFIEAEPEQEEAEEAQEEEVEEEPPGKLAEATELLKALLGIQAASEDGSREDSAKRDQQEEEEDDGSGPKGGYAQEQSEEKQERDRELLRERLAEADLVLTTALVPGKKAPVIVTEEMVDDMQPGSILVDIAVEAGGNCELTEPDEIVEHGGVKIYGPVNLPSGMPIHASQLYARNLAAVVSHLVEDGELNLDFEDQITDEACLAHGGEVRHEPTREALAKAASEGS